MGIFYLIPAAVLWIIWGVSWWFSAPWWIDYPVFGAACAATVVGGFLGVLVDSVDPRW